MTQKEPKTLAEMTEQEATAIFLAWRIRADIEKFCTFSSTWIVCGNYENLYRNNAYRLPQAQDKVPWDAIQDNINYVARSKNGNFWGFEAKPVVVNVHGAYFPSTGRGILLSGVKCVPGTLPWDESLQTRPGYDGDE